MHTDVQILEAKKLFIDLGKQYDKTFYILEAAATHGYIKDWQYAICKFGESYIKDKNKLGNKLENEGIDTSLIDYSAYYYFTIETVSQPELTKEDKKGFRYKLFADQWAEGFEKIRAFLSIEDLNRNLIKLKKTTTKLNEGEDVVPYSKRDVEELTSIIKEPSFLDSMLKDRKSLKEAFLEDPRAAYILKESPDIEGLVESFSEAMSYTIENHNTGNPVIGEQSKNRADEFARNMVEQMKTLNEQGFTSTRKIAEELNRLEIPTARGGRWSHDTVSKLNIRIKELGLDQKSEPETPSMD